MKRYIILFSIVLIGILLFAACGSAPAEPVATESPATEVAPEPATEAPAPAPAQKVLFKIVNADGSSFDITLDAVKALPLASITVEGKVQEGPKLSDVLALAGITEFTEVTLTGTGSSTLTFEQVDDNTILDFSNRGTMKLATTYIPKADWVKDIAEITIK